MLGRIALIWLNRKVGAACQLNLCTPRLMASVARRAFVDHHLRPFGHCVSQYHVVRRLQSVPTLTCVQSRGHRLGSSFITGERGGSIARGPPHGPYISHFDELFNLPLP